MAKRKQQADGIIAVRRGPQGPFGPTLLCNKPRILPGTLPKGFLNLKTKPPVRSVSRAGGFVLRGVDAGVATTVAHLQWCALACRQLTTRFSALNDWA